jgi:hypothetical protein
MREIKKIDQSKVSNIEPKVSEKSEPQFCANETNTKVVKDLSNQTEVLGRSQISKADNLASDIAFGMQNPQAIESADKFFNIAYTQLVKENDPNAYEKASSMASIYARELHK